MKRLVTFLIVVLSFFALTSFVSAAEASRTNPLTELLKIFLNLQNSSTDTSSTPPTGSTDTTLPSGTTDSTPPLPLEDYFPDPLPPISSNVSAIEKNAVLACLDKRSIYEQAGVVTGLPWQVLATIHSLEGGCGSGSLVSGRAIGESEPDVVRSGGCSTGVTGPGIPIVLPDGECGFASLLDSAIYAGKHLKGKIGKTPQDFEELIKAFGRYNGNGNQNCGRTPYTGCPAYFENEDHIYPMNWFDARHDTMYVVYCADREKCDPPVRYQKAGAMAVLRILEGKL